MSVKAFLKSKQFLLNLMLAVVIGVVLLLLTILILRIYTDHGKSFAVPDMKGMSEKEVSELCEEQGLRYQILDSLFLKDAVPGAVVDQVPQAGSQVKKNRMVFLTICARNPEPVAMPKLTDISYRQALNVMESTGLEIGEIEYKPSQFNNLVLEQKIEGEPVEVGFLIVKGTKIDLVIGQAFTGEKTEVPELVGETFQGAKEKLGQVILNLGAVIYDRSFETEEDSLNARVWKQRPNSAENYQIDQGQPVDVWLTVDKEKLEKALKNR